jgi:hypothetical protein
MITCQNCDHVNPMGTIFCHSCGERLNVSVDAISQSVAGTKKANLDDNVFRWGRSAVALGLFLLISALILRYVVVPPLPYLEYPVSAPITLFPKEAPPWAANMPDANGPATPGPASPAVTSAGPNQPTPVAPPGARLAWRRTNAVNLLIGFQLDQKTILGWQQTLLADQIKDGSFPGDDPIAATALVTAAFQAYPNTDAVITAAGRARAWLKQHTAEALQKPSLTRTLFALALLDAEELDPITRGNLGVFLLDGGAPVWQSYLLSLYPVADRPTQLSALRQSLKTPLWSCYFDLVLGQKPKPDPALLSAEAAKSLSGGELRMVWAFIAWQLPVAPKALAESLKTWSGSAPASVSADLAKACGKHAAEAVALLTVTAPLRLPPLWLQPKR